MLFNLKFIYLVVANFGASVLAKNHGNIKLNYLMTPKHENNMKRYKKYVNDIEKQKSMDDHFQCTTCNKI